MTSLSPLEECKRRRKTEVDRYYQTVLLTIGVKDFLDSENFGCRFVSAEPRFKEINSNKEISPDIVLQYDNDKFGILGEIKTSLPAIDFFLLERLKQLESYSSEVEGWDTTDKRVLNHDVILLCHALDSDRVVGKIRTWTDEEKLKISKKLCVVEWSIIQSLKFDQKDVFLIRHKIGETGCTALDNKFRKNIRFEVDPLITKYEKCKFVRKEPPLEYMMNQLWSCIFPGMYEITEDFSCSIDEILKVAYEYFIPWSGLQGEYSQVRKRWVRKAMKAFCDIGIAQGIKDTPDSYRIFYGKRIRKEVSEYFVERLCRNIQREMRKRPIKEALEETQHGLAEFG